MSSGIGDVYDDHREYERLCLEMGEEPVVGLPLASYERWSAHWEELKLLDRRKPR